jgi:hypothetical protein
MERTIYQDMTDEQDNLTWLLDSLGDLLDKCKATAELLKPAMDCLTSENCFPG